MEFCAKYPIDLPKLLETRLLVQAQSGGGKSWALRRLLEQTASGVQQLVIDPEGEFSTLREHFDYVIAAPHGADAIATPQTAALLSRRLLESGVSAILDIYDLKAHERQLFVRRFLDALVNAPRALWHPTMIVLDEAHIFAPQTGSAEASSAVIDLATRGRKRGLCLVAATQRLSKLHKDVAAELLNKLIGRTGLDVDVKRAGDELGLTAREALASLRDLDPGEFYAFGPALSRAVEKITIGTVRSTHPKSGNRMMQAPPAPSKRVLGQLNKLADLQKEAELEAKTIEDLQAANADLRRKVAAAEKHSKEGGIPESEVSKRIKEGVTAALALLPLPTVDDSALRQIAGLAEEILQLTVAIAPTIRSGKVTTFERPKINKLAAGTFSEGITVPQQKILDVLAQLDMFGVSAPNKSMVAVHAGVSPTSGGYFNNLGKLRSSGLVEYPAGGTVSMTEAGREKANFPDHAPSLEDLHNSWLAILPTPQAAILRIAIDSYPKNIGKDLLADAVGVSRTSGGYFNNLGRLRTLGAIDYPQKGTVRAADILFPIGG